MHLPSHHRYASNPVSRCSCSRGAWGWAAKAFYEFLAATAEERPNFTVLVAVKDEAQNRAGVGGSQNVYAAMRKFLGAAGYAYPGPRCYRCSYALVARIDKSGGDLLISREATDRRTIITAKNEHGAVVRYYAQGQKWVDGSVECDLRGNKFSQQTV